MYIEFTTLLSNGPVQASKPIVVTIFEVKDFDMSIIDKNCSFNPIRISNLQSQNNILMSNIKLLSCIAIEMANSDTERSTQCTQCVLNSFANGNIQIKSTCLRYFGQLFKHTLSLSKMLQPMFVWILKCIEDIENRISVWIHQKLAKTDDVEVYVASVNELLESPHIFKLFDAEYLRQTMNICVQILRTHHNLRTPAYDQIIPSIFTLLKSISCEVGDEFTRNNLFEFVKASLVNDIEFQRYIELLGPAVLEQMKNAHIQSWYLADQKIEEILNHQNPSTETMINQMKCVCSILNTVRFIEHNLMIHSQREYCSKNGVTDYEQEFPANLRKVFRTQIDKLPRRLLPQLQMLSKHVKRNFSLLLTTKYSPLVDATTLLLFTEIAIGILSVYDSLDIDDYLQSQLVLIALCPFIRCSELLFNHLQQSFEEETARLNRIMESPFIRNNDVNSWQEHVLQLITGFNLNYISTKNKEICMDILNQICNNLKQLDCLDQIIHVLISCAIQVNAYSIADLERFIESVASDPKNHQVISRHLCGFYCLSSGLTYIFQVNKGNYTYAYKVVCPKCDTHLNFIGHKANVMLQLIEKTNGKFVRTLTTQYNIQNKCHLDYFKLFKSNVSQIRANMSFSLPPILNHLDLNLFSEAADYWLNPITDSDIDIRLWMTKYMTIFPKCGNQIILSKCLDKLLQCTKMVLMSEKKSDQLSALQLISSFATSKEITEPMLLNCFRMCLYFCMCSKSMVSRQAALRATEMCYKFGITPKNLLIWYKTDIFKQIVTICVSNYISYNIGLQKSLRTVSRKKTNFYRKNNFMGVFISSQVSQLFGYTDEKQDFIVEYNGIILAMLVPWFIKQAKCIDLIVEICDIIQKDMASTLSNAFLPIYLHMYLQ